MSGIGPMSPTQAPGDLMQGLGQEHDQAKALFAKTSEGSAMLKQVRAALDGLVQLSDMVTVDDVIKASGKLVAAGLTPKAVAGLLAGDGTPKNPGMPTQGGQALASWLDRQDADVTQREQTLMQAHEQARHQLVTSSMHMILAHDHVHPGSPMQQSLNPAAPSPGGPTQGTNPLMPQ